MDFSFPARPHLLEDLELSDPHFVDETAIGQIWKVQRIDGQFAALKLYHKSGMGNEAFGFSYLEGLEGDGAANIYHYDEQVALMEWLDGPSLGDMCREGDDRGASELLVEVANKIHKHKPVQAQGAPVLDEWFKSLFDLIGSAEADMQAVSYLLRACALADDLLKTQTDVCMLHGDLHHDNVRLGDRGYCAFDAKGVVGERTYELANAFRNPKGAKESVFDRDRIEFLADQWSSSFQVPRKRLLQWAAAKCALSIAWQSKGRFTSNPEIELLEMLLDAEGAC